MIIHDNSASPQGRSIPLPTDEPMTPRALYDIPGKPGRPFATDADNHFIRVSWKPPSNNGGSKITGYDVERRDLLGGRWIRVTSRPVPATDFMDNDVTEGRSRICRSGLLKLVFHQTLPSQSKECTSSEF